MLVNIGQLIIPSLSFWMGIIVTLGGLFSSVQLLSRVQLFVTPWTTALQASLSITNFRSLLKHMSIESVMPSNHLFLCRPLLLPPSIFPSISSVQLSRIWLSATPWTAAHQASLSITNSGSLLKLMSIESVMASKHLILCNTSPSPALNLSQHLGLFQWVCFSHQVAKVLELQLQQQSVLPMNIQGWFILGLTGLISLLSKGLWRVFSSISSLVLSLLYGLTLTSVHDYWKNHSFD